jgi:hypothetical protein
MEEKHRSCRNTIIHNGNYWNIHICVNNYAAIRYVCIYSQKDGKQIVAETRIRAEWLRDEALIVAVRHANLTLRASAFSRPDTSATVWTRQLIHDTREY